MNNLIEFTAKITIEITRAADAGNLTETLRLAHILRDEIDKMIKRLESIPMRRWVADDETRILETLATATTAQSQKS